MIPTIAALALLGAVALTASGILCRWGLRWMDRAFEAQAKVDRLEGEKKRLEAWFWGDPSETTVNERIGN